MTSILCVYSYSALMFVFIVTHCDDVCVGRRDSTTGVEGAGSLPRRQVQLRHHGGA